MFWYLRSAWIRELTLILWQIVSISPSVLCMIECVYLPNSLVHGSEFCEFSHTYILTIPFLGLRTYLRSRGFCRLPRRIFLSALARGFTFLRSLQKQSFNFIFINKKMWCLCNNSQWMTISTTKQVFYLSCCEAVNSASLPRADPQRHAVPCISMESAPPRILLRKVL